MHTNYSNINQELHRGTFADGEARPDLHSDEGRRGTFVDGEATPDTYPGDDEVGTFAEGQARPNQYGGEDQEGTFAEGVTPTASQPASQTYKLVPESVPRDSRLHRSTHAQSNATPYADPTQGREVGAEPTEDPTQGRELGTEPYEDPTQATRP